MKNILFICRHNRFRSKVAEAYFNKINKNKNLKVKSAGIFIGNYPLDKTQTAIAKKFKIKLKGKPQGISTKLLKWNDLIIVITDDLPRGLLNYSDYKTKVIEWKIKDEINGNKQNIEKIIMKIIKKVNKLVKKMKNYEK